MTGNEVPREQCVRRAALSIYLDPLYLQVVKLHRQGVASAVVPTPFTKVQYEDVLTLCGSSCSISAVTGLKKGIISLVNTGGSR